MPESNAYFRDGTTAGTVRLDAFTLYVDRVDYRPSAARSENEVDKTHRVFMMESRRSILAPLALLAFAVTGRRGGRPLNLEEMQRLYLRDGVARTVRDRPPDR